MFYILKSQIIGPVFVYLLLIWQKEEKCTLVKNKEKTNIIIIIAFLKCVIQ